MTQHQTQELPPSDASTPLPASPALEADYAVSPADIEQYRRDGFVILRNVLTPGQVAAMRAILWDKVRQQMRKLRPMGERDTYGKAFVQIMHLWARYPDVRTFALSPRFGRIVAELFGVSEIPGPGAGAGAGAGAEIPGGLPGAEIPGVRMFHDQVLFKEPGGGYTPWHQDQYYIPFDTDAVLTMWLPLVDVSESMGTMNFAAGSHKAGMLFDQVTSDQTQAEFEAMIAGHGWPVVKTGDMRVGDVSFHAGWTIHGTGPNVTDRMREVFNVVYFADGARVVERGAWQGAVRAHLGDRRPGQVADGDGNPVVWRG